MFEATPNITNKVDFLDTAYRKSSQPLLPQHIDSSKEADKYTLYPYHSIGPDKIFTGHASLADWISTHSLVIIDGYSGVLWEMVRRSLQSAFDEKKQSVRWIDIAGYMKPSAQIDAMVSSFLGTPDSVWGTKCKYKLHDFFDLERIKNINRHETSELIIVYGTGAALVNWEAPIVYLDVPKNEVQYRMRARSITNLGCEEAFSNSEMYKRFYFVDWVLLNDHKKNILDRISVVADTQWGVSLNWMFAESLKDGLTKISRNTFRVRPWFEPGAWGGQWLKSQVNGINQEEINYAWSFEMIVPENGVVFESSGYLLEVSFDFLMFTDNAAVLGKHAAIFGDEFPIRFDFLDTWEGGNLSIQCHPSLSYIRKEFGENITQDETYYILDSKDDAKVYLGFQDDIAPHEFREMLETSKEKNQEIQIDRFVQSFPAKKHELFLIPNGTIHSAGANNLVLEISATPYIFTFKMYDWLRMDLNGEPRAINIEHAFNNLRFERKGKMVQEELISKPNVLAEGVDFKVVHLPTHREHFYDVHRLDFHSEISVDTNDACHVLMLVEGTSVSVRTAEGMTRKYYYAETFVIPAAAGNYTLVNEGEGIARVIKAFIKNDFKKLDDGDQKSTY